MAMAVMVILVLGPILTAAQREQLSEDSFTTDADEYMIDKNIMMKVKQVIKIQCL